MNQTPDLERLLEDDIETAKSIMSFGILLFKSELSEKPVQAYNSTGEFLIKYPFKWTSEQIISEMLKRALIEEISDYDDLAFRPKTGVDPHDSGKFYKAKDTI